MELRCIRCDKGVEDSLDPDQIVHSLTCSMRGNGEFITQSSIILQRDGLVRARYDGGVCRLIYQGREVRRADVGVQAMSEFLDGPMIEFVEHPGQQVMIYTLQRYERLDGPPIYRVLHDLTVSTEGVLRLHETGAILRHVCIFEPL